MDVTLEEHGAKHVYRVPEGLRELCSDISREPIDIYGFIADYAKALLTTRQNAREAARVVKNIVTGSEAIVSILRETGLSLGQIAVAAPRLQKAFGKYLDAVDARPDGGLAQSPGKRRKVRQSSNESSGSRFDDESKVSIREILKSVGARAEIAGKAATLIQTAFRGHYEKMLEREVQGQLAEWEKTVEITTSLVLKRAGVSRTEAEDAATLIQSAYRGYYARRNTPRMKIARKVEESIDRPSLGSDLPESRKSVEAVAWLGIMYEDSGLDSQRENEAATLIQRSYRNYRSRRLSEQSRVATLSANSLAVIDEETPRRSRDDIPREFEDDTEEEAGEDEEEDEEKKDAPAADEMESHSDEEGSKTDNDEINETIERSGLDLRERKVYYRESIVSDDDDSIGASGDNALSYHRGNDGGEQ